MAKLVRDLSVLEDALENMRNTVDCNSGYWAVIEELVSGIIEGEKHKEFKKKRNVKADFEGLNIKQDIDRITNFLTNVPISHKRAKDELVLIEQELCDLSHEPECFGERDDAEKIKFYDEFERLRALRRKYKNFLYMTDPVIEYVKEHPLAIAELKRLVSKVSKMDNILIEWTYKPRRKEYTQDELKKFVSPYKK